MMDTVLFQGDNWLYIFRPVRLFSPSHARRGNRLVPRGPASVVGLYRRCANDERARDTEGSGERERGRERKLMKEREGGGTEEERGRKWGGRGGERGRERERKRPAG